MNWPPEITIKKHARARHVKLRVTVQKGLELVVPRRFNQKEVPAILDKHRSWIEEQLLSIQSYQQQQDVLPEKLEFHSIKQTWSISHIANPAPLKLLSRPHLNELIFFGDNSNKALCKKLLTAWLKKYAQVTLFNLLKAVSQEIKLPFEKLTIRNQRSRWGSCSVEKNISLNYKLIFLPYELVRHVLVHELCHTVHLDHSEQFWQCVAKFDPNWKEHKRLLRESEKFTPHP